MIPKISTFYQPDMTVLAAIQPQDLQTTEVLDPTKIVFDDGSQSKRLVYMNFVSIFLISYYFFCSELTRNLAVAKKLNEWKPN